MVQPTVSTLTPADGYFIGGYRVDITGTDFLTQSDAFGFDYDPSDTAEIFQKVAAFNPPMPTPAPIDRMKIELDFGGGKTVEVPRVHVPTSTKLWFLMPRVAATGNSGRDITYTEVADLVLTPLDPSGVPIIGDQLIVVGAVTLGLPQTGRESGGADHSMVHNIVTAGLVRDFRSYVHPNSVLIPAEDFERGVATLRSSTKLPAVVITGPESQRPLLRSKKWRSVQLSASSTDQYQLRSAEARDFVYDIFILHDNHRHELDMVNNLEAYVLRTQYFRLTLFPSAPQPFQITSTMMFERYPGIDAVPSLLPSSIRQANARIRLTGIPVGLYGDLAREIVITSGQVLKSSIIHQTSESADDVNQDTEPRIIEE